MSEESYYLKFGTRRLRMMRFIEKENGEQMVIFHLHGGGFHITKHPLGANPHMVNKKTGFRRELDLRALRGHDWNADLPGFQRAFESLFYWPAHRADLIAFPGPPGKTWVRAFEDVCKGPDLDIMEYLRLVLGYGTLFKVGYLNDLCSASALRTDLSSSRCRSPSKRGGRPLTMRPRLARKSSSRRGRRSSRGSPRRSPQN